jgi:S-(hydroxymethyl)glutathione dehydrogenase/alcohol dehydrogenase
MVVQERALVVIPNEMPLDRAALLGCAVTTGLGAVLNSAQVPAGASVAVLGCGGVGLNCVQGARLAGAAQIVAIDRQPAKLALAQQFGATDLVDAGNGLDVVKAVARMSAGGVEYSFEAIGSSGTVAQAVAMLRPGGLATIIGVFAGGTIEIPADEVVIRGKRVQGAVMGSNRFRLDLPRYVQLYRQGRLQLDELIGNRIALDDVNDAMRELQSGTTVRTVIVFDR